MSNCFEPTNCIIKFTQIDCQFFLNILVGGRVECNQYCDHSSEDLDNSRKEVKNEIVIKRRYIVNGSNHDNDFLCDNYFDQIYEMDI